MLPNGFGERRSTYPCGATWSCSSFPSGVSYVHSCRVNRQRTRRQAIWARSIRPRNGGPDRPRGTALVLAINPNSADSSTLPLRVRGNDWSDRERQLVRQPGRSRGSSWRSEDVDELVDESICFSQILRCQPALPVRDPEVSSWALDHRDARGACAHKAPLPRPKAHFADSDDGASSFRRAQVIPDKNRASRQIIMCCWFHAFSFNPRFN